MPGTAVLDPNVLVDDLVTDVIDGLRGDLHPLFGIRAYRLFTILRTFPSGRVGDGAFTEIATELDPQPLVEVWDGMRFELKDCGLDELGIIRVREVSLTYTEAELIGPKPLAAGQQWFIRLNDAHGQLTSPKFFFHTRPPYVDRNRDMGWVMWLRAVRG